MIIPRDKYIHVGGLNENLVFYGEEPEFGFRTDRLGYKTLYYAGASIFHLGGISTNSDNAKKNTFEKGIKEYDSLVSETVGYREAIAITRRTRTSLKIKRLFYKNTEFIDSRIAHETKVIQYFKRKLQ